MRSGVALLVAALLSGCVAPGPDTTAAPAPPPVVAMFAAPPMVMTRGMPAVPASLAESASRYTAFRGHRFVAWHPLQRDMLVSWQAPGAQTPQLWRLPAPLATPEALTTGSDPVTVATYEPQQGRYVVFERDVGGNEATQLFRLDLASHVISQISEPGPRHTLQRWMHRGSRLLVMTSTSTANATVLASIDPMQPTDRRQLADLPGSGWSVGAVSWDDRSIALNHVLPAGDSQVWLLTLATGRLVQFLPAKPTDRPTAWRASGFTPDNTSLWVTGDPQAELGELARIAIATHRRTAVGRATAADIDRVGQSADGRLLAARAMVDGRGELRLIDTRTLKERVAQTLPDGQVDDARFHRRLPDLALTISSPQSPPQVFTYDPTSREIEQWTRATSAPGVDMAAFGEQTVARWPSFDGRGITGLVNTPPARFSGRRPVMIVLHDGPQGQATAGFIGRLNYLVDQQGIAIVQPDLRGSTGHGRGFASLADGAAQDLAALLDWIATQPNLDASRVVIGGVGDGASLALAAAARYTDRIASTIALHAVPPFPAIDRPSRPTLVAAGSNDPHAPYADIERLVDRLRESGTTVWYLRADDEGHGFQRQANADYLFFATLLFLRETILR